MEYLVKKLDSSSLDLFKQAIQLFHREFETGETGSAPDDHLAQLLKNPLFICFVILHKSNVAAALTAYEMPQYYSGRSEAYIYDLAVANHHQRKGLGTQLMNALKDYGNSHNIHLAFAEAHAEDLYALEFYQSVGGEPENVMHFNYRLTE